MKIITLIEQLLNIQIVKLKIYFNELEILSHCINDCNGFNIELSKNHFTVKLTYIANKELNETKKDLLIRLIESHIEFTENINAKEIINFIEILDTILKKETLETILNKILNQLLKLYNIECAGIYFLNSKLLQLRGLIYINKNSNSNCYLFKKEVIEFKEKNELSDILFFEQIKKISLINNEFFPLENYGIGIYTAKGPVGLLVVSLKTYKKSLTEEILVTYSKAIALAFEITTTLKKYQFAVNDLNFFKENIYKNSNLINIGKFSATIAHELKNPLVSIGGFINRLIKITNEEKSLKYLNIIKHEVERMESLIQDLLFYSKNLQIKLKKENLLNIVEEAVSILYEKISYNQIELEINIKRDIYLYIDKNKIIQVLLNIINNSIDAMKGVNNKLKITSKYTNNYIILEIIDNGIGIPQEYLSKIFTPFFTTKENGNGLGLPISKKIMEAHNGDIKIYSDKNGTIINLYFNKEEKNG